MSAQRRDPAQLRAQRDTGLIRLRTLNAGMVVAGVAAIGVAAAGVAVATPGHHSAAANGQSTGSTPTSGDRGTSDDSGSNARQSPQQANPHTNPPAATTGGS
jgi:hypothetical protein